MVRLKLPTFHLGSAGVWAASSISPLFTTSLKSRLVVYFRIYYNGKLGAFGLTAVFKNIEKEFHKFRKFLEVKNTTKSVVEKKKSNMLSSNFDCSANFLGSNDKSQNTSEKNLNKHIIFCYVCIRL